MKKFNFSIRTDSNFLSHWFQQQRTVSSINKKIGTYFVNLVVVESICSTRMLNSARTYIASPKRSSISPGRPSHSFASRRTWRSPPVSHTLWDREVAPTREPAPYSISILVSWTVTREIFRQTRYAKFGLHSAIMQTDEWTMSALTLATVRFSCYSLGF